jgi:hypothetical protein
VAAHPIPPEVMRAVEQFTAHVTIPVLYDDPAAANQIGTGTLFTVDRRLFLVTARHLFDNQDLTRFSIPAPPDPQLHTLGEFNLLRPTEEVIDVAVLELKANTTINRLTSGWWRPLTLENVAPASQQGLFALCGYPSERAVVRGGLIGGSLITAYTERVLPIPPEAEPPIIPNLDLFFHYDAQAIDLKGKAIATPHLGGCSGASIWEYREPKGILFWTPEQCLHIVGVQSSFRRGRYFRGKSWAAVLEVLRQTDQSLRAAVDAYNR